MVGIGDVCSWGVIWSSAKITHQCQFLQMSIVNVTTPVNRLAAGPYAKVSRAEFAKIDVARISLGAALARVTHRVISDAAKAMFEQGDFTPLTHSISGDVVDDLLS